MTRSKKTSEPRPVNLPDIQDMAKELAEIDKRGTSLRGEMSALSQRRQMLLETLNVKQLKEIAANPYITSLILGMMKHERTSCVDDNPASNAYISNDGTMKCAKCTFAWALQNPEEFSDRGFILYLNLEVERSGE